MLVFYSMSLRLVAESIGLFGGVEKLAWLANHAPQEGGRLAPPPPPGKGKPDGRDGGGRAPRTLPEPKPTHGVSLPPRAESLAVELQRAGGAAVPQGWPRTGDVAFSGVVMKYAPHLPPALRDVTFSIHGGDKVGVVGRTGSGKSTLLLALYR